MAVADVFKVSHRLTRVTLSNPPNQHMERILFPVQLQNKDDRGKRLDKELEQLIDQDQIIVNMPNKGQFLETLKLKVCYTGQHCITYVILLLGLAFLSAYLNGS